MSKGLFIIILAFFGFGETLSNAQEREVFELTEGWRFKRGQLDNAQLPSYDDSSWEVVTVPHDWAIKGPFDKNIDKQVVAITQNGESVPTEKTGRTGALPYIGEGWYRNTFEIKDFDQSKKVILSFDGAMSEPKVYINGEKVGQWNYGYNYFFFDISNFVISGVQNTIAVHLSNTGLSSRWYPGEGLYRKVKVICKDKQSIDHWGVNITTPYISTDLAKVNVKTKASGSNLEIVTRIFDESGMEVASASSKEQFNNEFDQNIGIPNPHLWDIDSPYLYVAVSEVYSKGILIDKTKTRFGIRSIEYKASKGFLLNGKVTKFKGVCLHHDLGPLGTAVNLAALRRQLRIMKDMGANAIRSAHNMPSIEQLELCDEMGLLFLAESFDEWKVPKVENGYARFFETDVKKDIVNLVRATRNHPCIVMWSSGNEVPDQNDPEGSRRARMIQDIFHREDPTRPVTVGMDQVKSVMESGFGAVVDVPGLNYRVHLYREAYEKFPQGMILGSETSSTVSSRGVYKFPVVKGADVIHSDYQSSSYDVEHCIWSNLLDEDAAVQADYDWVIGEFVWTGFDYLGEPTPYDEVWPSRSSYFGICDLAGLPKDRYYHYRSRWNTKDTTLHILPHWNWEGKEGDTIPVYAYTNFNAAELFVNGESQGIQTKRKDSPQHRFRLMWNDVVYQPGEIKVVALDDDGKPVKEKSIRTSLDPYQIVLETDRETISADGKDLSFITVSVVDKNGTPCPTASNSIRFDVKGAGQFKAVCNGDPTSLELFHLPKMKLFSGKLVVVVQAGDQAGDMQIKVSGKGLRHASALIKVQSQ